jgi:hypothetical protein
LHENEKLRESGEVARVYRICMNLAELHESGGVASLEELHQSGGVMSVQRNLVSLDKLHESGKLHKSGRFERAWKSCKSL